MAEHHGFQHVVWDRSAVDRDEFFIFAGRLQVHEARHHFLAAATGTIDKHTDLRLCNASGQIIEPPGTHPTAPRRGPYRAKS